MTSSDTTLVLVGPLRRSRRQDDLLSALQRLPGPLQSVLRECYLEGRTRDDVASSASLTERELADVHGRALRALGRAIKDPTVS